MRRSEGRMKYLDATYTVATICPDGEGVLSPGPYPMRSDMNPDRYGQKVKRLPMKYATEHFKMFLYNRGMGGILNVHLLTLVAESCLTVRPELEVERERGEFGDGLVDCGRWKSSNIGSERRLYSDDGECTSTGGDSLTEGTCGDADTRCPREENDALKASRQLSLDRRVSAIAEVAVYPRCSLFSIRSPKTVHSCSGFPRTLKRRRLFVTSCTIEEGRLREVVASGDVMLRKILGRLGVLVVSGFGVNVSLSTADSERVDGATMAGGKLSATPGKPDICSGEPTKACRRSMSGILSAVGLGMSRGWALECKFPASDAMAAPD